MKHTEITAAMTPMETPIKTETKNAEASNEEVILYLGAKHGHGNNTKHLAREGDYKTLCNSTELVYNQKGEIHGQKKATYRGPDRVLGRLCTQCQEKHKEEADNE